MGDVVRFPTPLPALESPQDVGLYTDQINQIIRYINTIAYGTNIGNTALLKANNLSDLDNAVAARSNLGLGSAATQNSSAFDAAGAAAAVLASSLQKASNLADLVSAPAARVNLGLGTAATHAYGDFDPAGAAAARAAQGINGDITALTALSVTTNVTANHTVVPGDQTLECDASGGALTVVYGPAVAAGRVKVLKVDSSYNAVNISDGTNVLYSLVAPMNGLAQCVEIYSNGAALRIT
jgi:hypothetical protein